MKSFFFHSVNCVVSEWSSCSSTCGPGTQTREIQTEAQPGGTQCPNQLAKSCIMEDCPG